VMGVDVCDTRDIALGSRPDGKSREAH
jgi:hypothetical protein